MKLKIKNLKTKFLYIILPVGLILILVIVLYQSNQKIKLLKSGIDLKPRPFSELLATDFADVKDEVADPSKCDGSKVIEQIKKSSTNPNLSDKWKDYDPNIHKLTILDDCWRQYENEYVRFRFRDLNGSLRIYSPYSFEVQEGEAFYGLTILFPKKEKKSLVESFIQYIKKYGDQFIDLEVFVNQEDVKIYRIKTITHQVIKDREVYYFMDIPNTDRFAYVKSYSDLISQDILSTIEIKK